MQYLDFDSGLAVFRPLSPQLEQTTHIKPHLRPQHDANRLTLLSQGKLAKRAIEELDTQFRAFLYSLTASTYYHAINRQKLS